MWEAAVETLEGGRVQRVRILCDGGTLSYAGTLKCWQSDDAFCAFFTGILAAAPYRAYLWETPPIAAETSHRPFEFVLVDSPGLAGFAPDPQAFASYFEASAPGQGVAVFPNLGGDVLLVAPTPQAPDKSYSHLAAFARSAPEDQQHAFWRSLGATVAERLGDRPLWLSTNGLGVAWLHARLDSRPKYYSFAPYRHSD
jgi:hypothetical protein